VEKLTGRRRRRLAAHVEADLHVGAGLVVNRRPTLWQRSQIANRYSCFDFRPMIAASLAAR